MIEAHHDDYSEPLNVRWLCQFCHQAWHKKNGRGTNATPSQTRDAHKAVTNAIQELHLIRPDRCGECGETRSGRMETPIFEGELSCPQCGGSFKPQRSHAKYCSAKCRRAAFDERSCKGRIASARRLKSGKISIVIHMLADAGLKPGDQVKVGK